MPGPKQGVLPQKRFASFFGDIPPKSSAPLSESAVLAWLRSASHVSYVEKHHEKHRAQQSSQDSSQNDFRAGGSGTQSEVHKNQRPGHIDGQASDQSIRNLMDGHFACHRHDRHDENRVQLAMAGTIAIAGGSGTQRQVRKNQRPGHVDGNCHVAEGQD